MTSPLILCVQHMTLSNELNNLFGKARGAIPITDTNTVDKLVEALEQDKLWLGPRSILEHLPSFRQLIPYIVVRYKDEVIMYYRNKKAGEARLHHMASIGFGGHIELDDLETKWIDGEHDKVYLMGTLLKAATRELQEELLIEISQDAFKIIGVINLAGTTVNDVHTGILMIVNLTERHPLPEVIISDGLERFSYIPINSLKKRSKEFVVEAWTEAILPLL